MPNQSLAPDITSLAIPDLPPKTCVKLYLRLFILIQDLSHPINIKRQPCPYYQQTKFDMSVKQLVKSTRYGWKRLFHSGTLQQLYGVGIKDFPDTVMGQGGSDDTDPYKLVSDKEVIRSKKFNWKIRLIINTKDPSLMCFSPTHKIVVLKPYSDEQKQITFEFDPDSIHKGSECFQFYFRFGDAVSRNMTKIFLNKKNKQSPYAAIVDYYPQGRKKNIYERDEPLLPVSVQTRQENNAYAPNREPICLELD